MFQKKQTVWIIKIDSNVIKMIPIAKDHACHDSIEEHGSKYFMRNVSSNPWLIIASPFRNIKIPIRNGVHPSVRKVARTRLGLFGWCLSSLNQLFSSVSVICVGCIQIGRS